MFRVVLLSTLVAATAAADSAELALGERQLVLQPRGDIFEDDPVDPYWRATGFAQIVGGSSGGDVGVGGAVAISGVGCDLVEVAAQGRVAYDENEQVGDARYSLCLTRVLFTIAFDGRRGFGIAPSFADRRSLWSRRYTTSYDRTTIGFGELWRPSNPDVRHTIAIVAVGHGVTHQVDDIDERTIKQLDLDLTLYRYRNLGPSQLRIDAISVTSNAIKAGSTNQGGIASAFVPVRASMVDGELFASGHAGWGMTGGQLSASSETNGQTTWSETIDGGGLPIMTKLVGEVTAGWRRERMVASATIARTFYPTFDGNLALEERASGHAELEVGSPKRPLKISLAPFIARTRTWTRDAMDSRDITTGASLYVGRDVSKQFRVDAIAEGAKSPYARLDGERLPSSSSVGGQVLVAVSGRVSR